MAYFLTVLIVLITMPFNVYAEAIEFQLRHEIKTTTKDGDQKVDGVSTVNIEPHLFSTRSEDSEKIYDFKSNKIISIDHGAREYIETSLYAIPAFFEFEKKNRLKMADVIKSANIEKKFEMSTLFELETIFGGAENNNPPQGLENRQEKDRDVFSYNGKDVVSYTLSDQTMNKPLLDTYKKYFVYAHSIHPYIRQKLVSKNMLPKELSYKNKNSVFSTTEKKYTLKSTSPTKERQNLIPEGYQQLYARDKTLNEIIKSSYSLSPKSIAEYIEQMNEHLEGGEYLEAYLLFHETNIQHGAPKDERLNKIIRRVFKEAPESVWVKDLTVAITKPESSKEGFEKAIKVIENYQKKVKSGAHVLDIFLANHYATIGQARKSKALLLSALKKNPFLTGAYKDLGDKYFRTYDMTTAWICWDQMRRLQPDHGLATSVNKLEHNIRKGRPAYFK